MENKEKNKTIKSLDEIHTDSSIMRYNFGDKLYTARRKVNLTRAQMAKKLEISSEEYEMLENGAKIPDENLARKIAHIVDVPEEEVIGWLVNTRHYLEEKPVEVPRDYIEMLDKTMEEGVKWYKQRHDDKKIDERTLKSIEQLKEDILKIFILPASPQSVVLIFKALSIAKTRGNKTLGEIKYPIIPGENFVDFLVREPTIGLQLISAIKLNYFQTKTYTDTIDCLNQTTITEFEDVLYPILLKGGIYRPDQRGRAQQFMEFGSIAPKFVMLLKKHLKSVCFDDMLLAATGQNLGTYALFTLVFPNGPQILSTRENKMATSPVYKGINEELFYCLVYKIHHVVSLILLYKWNLSLGVRLLVQAHHVDHKTKELSEADEIFKVVNTLSNLTLDNLGIQELADFMEGYPQVTIPIKVLAELCPDFNNIKKEIVERSSIALQSMIPTIGKFDQKKIVKPEETQQDDQSHPFLWGFPLYYLPSDSDRFKPEFQNVLGEEAACLIIGFIDEKNSHKQGETITDFGQRISLLNIRSGYVRHRDIEIVADHWHMSQDEVRKRLKLK